MLLTQAHHAGQDPFVTTGVRNFSWISVSPQFQLWLWVHLALHNQSLALTAQYTCCCWVLGRLQLDVFPMNGYMLLPYPVLDLVSCFIHLVKNLMILRAGSQGHLFAQAGNCVPYTFTRFGHFWRCCWFFFSIFHMRAFLFVMLALLTHKNVSLASRNHTDNLILAPSGKWKWTNRVVWNVLVPFSVFSNVAAVKAFLIWFLQVLGAAHRHLVLYQHVIIGNYLFTQNHNYCCI